MYCMHAHLMEQFISVIISFTSSTLVSLWLLTSFQRVFFSRFVFLSGLFCFVLFFPVLFILFFSRLKKRLLCFASTSTHHGGEWHTLSKRRQELPGTALQGTELKKTLPRCSSKKKKQMKFHFKNCLFSGYSDAFLCFWLFVLICCTET